MDSRQIAHDLAVAMAVKQAATPDEAVARYFDLLAQIKKSYEVEAAKQGMKTAVVPK